MYYLLGNGAYAFVSVIINYASELGKHPFSWWAVRRPAARAERRASDFGDIRRRSEGTADGGRNVSSMFNKE